jgi:hypothetical protein
MKENTRPPRNAWRAQGGSQLHKAQFYQSSSAELYHRALRRAKSHHLYALRFAHTYTGNSQMCTVELVHRCGAVTEFRQPIEEAAAARFSTQNAKEPVSQDRLFAPQTNEAPSIFSALRIT